MRKMKNLTFVFFIAAAVFVGCESDNAPTPTNSGNGGDDNNQNFNPSWSYSLKGNTYTSTSFLADYGAKIYVTGLGGDGNLLVDFAIPVQKDETLSNNKITLNAGQTETKGIVYIGSAQWGISDGTINVTKHENNRISGNFSGKAYQLDYSGGSEPMLVDSAQVSNGVFTDILVSE